MNITTKYTIRQQVWLMQDNRAISLPILGIKTETVFNPNESESRTFITYGLQDFSQTSSGRTPLKYYNDTKFYASKAELLASL